MSSPNSNNISNLNDRTKVPFHFTYMPPSPNFGSFSPSTETPQKDLPKFEELFNRLNRTIDEIKSDTQREYTTEQLSEISNNMSNALLTMQKIQCEIGRQLYDKINNNHNNIFRFDSPIHLPSISSPFNQQQKPSVVSPNINFDWKTPIKTNTNASNFSLDFREDSSITNNNESEAENTIISSRTHLRSWSNPFNNIIETTKIQNSNNPFAVRTKIEVHCKLGENEFLFLRGTPGTEVPSKVEFIFSEKTSWEEGILLEEEEETDCYSIVLSKIPENGFEFKLLLNDDIWEKGDNRKITKDSEDIIIKDPEF